MGDIVRTSHRSPVLLIDATGIAETFALRARIVSANGSTVTEQAATIANQSIVLAVDTMLPNGAFVVRLLDREHVLREYVFAVSPEGGASPDRTCGA